MLSQLSCNEQVVEQIEQWVNEQTHSPLEELWIMMIHGD